MADVAKVRVTTSSLPDSHDPVRARLARIALAREDINVFCEFVMKEEGTGKAIRQASVHKKWQRLAQRHSRLILWASVECGKTQQLSVAYPLFQIGRNPNIRIAILSKTEKQALKIVGVLSQYLLSEEYRQVFPHIRPWAPWNAHALTVARRAGIKEPTVQAFGIHGNVLGARIDLLIIDDPLSYENTRTEDLRNDTYQWYVDTLVGRLTEDAQVIMVANAWHPRDMLHRLKDTPGNVWYTEKFPIWEPDSETGQMVSVWPEKWPLKRIRKRKRELIADLVSFRRQYECVAVDDASTVFRREWIDVAMQRGRGRSWADGLIGLSQIPEGYAIYIGVDLATKRTGKRRRQTDETVFSVVARHPNGDRELIYIEAGRWYGPQIVRKIEELYRKFLGIIWVESNAAQKFIVDFLEESIYAPTVFCFETHAVNKLDPNFGVASLATELANGRWIFPNEIDKPLRPDLMILIEDMMSYHPASHAGDRLMSLWIAREGLRMGDLRPEVAHVDTLRR